MSKIFITSDTFFGRRGIIRKAKRPFKTVEEMNSEMIRLWNSIVAENDIVYHLGNFAWDFMTAIKILEQLNGKIYFMVGEYDKSIREIAEYFDDKVKILPRDIYKHKGLKSIMCHWPLSTWPGHDKGIYHFHGNTIDSLKTDMNVKLNRINVCCDLWGLKPIDINQAIELIEEAKKNI